jgi:hypothetical protein
MRAICCGSHPGCLWAEYGQRPALQPPGNGSEPNNLFQFDLKQPL